MDPLTSAVYQRLTGDGAIAAGLADYRGLPAVFTDDRVPTDAVLPYIVSSGNVAEEPWDTKTMVGRRPTRDVGVYAEHQQTGTVEAVAWRVRELLHRQAFAVDGYRMVLAKVSGPIRISADDYDGRVLTVRFALAKENS